MPTDTIKMMFRDLKMSIRAPEEGEEENRIVVFRGVTERVASDGGILRVNGADWSRMDENETVKWNHGSEPIGKIVKREINRKDKAVDFHIQFATPEESEFADSRYRLIKGGYLKAASIGFERLELEQLSDKQREKLGLGPYGWVASRWMPYELSIVPHGSDPGALKRALSSGIIREDDIDNKMMTRDHQDDEPEPVTEPDAPTQDTRSITALEENTRAHQRTQAVMASLVDEIAGLRIDIAESGTGPESPHVPVAAPDDRSKEREQEARELKQRLDALLAKYGESK